MAKGMCIFSLQHNAQQSTWNGIEEKTKKKINTHLDEVGVRSFAYYSTQRNPITFCANISSSFLFWRLPILLLAVKCVLTLSLIHAINKNQRLCGSCTMFWLIWRLLDAVDYLWLAPFFKWFECVCFEGLKTFFLFCPFHKFRIMITINPTNQIISILPKFESKQFDETEPDDPKKIIRSQRIDLDRENLCFKRTEIASKAQILAPLKRE